MIRGVSHVWPSCSNLTMLLLNKVSEFQSKVITVDSRYLDFGYLE